MRYEAIKKRGEQWVRIRPALQVYDQSAVLRDTVEDAWLISQITENSLQLQSRDTQHFKIIGLDHIYSYMEDPEGQRTHGTTGMLVMKVQLLLYEGELHVEPVGEPGNPLKVFVPAKPRATLLHAAARMRAEAELERARKEYTWSAEGVQASDKAFAEFQPAIEVLRTDLGNAGVPIEMVVRVGAWNAFLLGVAGRWVSFVWERMASNCIEDSILSITQWSAHPHWPGYRVFEPGSQVAKEKYSFGLAALNQPRWLAVSNPELSYTTMDLAQNVLTRLLATPNNRPR